MICVELLLSIACQLITLLIGVFTLAVVILHLKTLRVKWRGVGLRTVTCGIGRRISCLQEWKVDVSIDKGVIFWWSLGCFQASGYYQ